jgi:hypothetical protein
MVSELRGVNGQCGSLEVGKEDERARAKGAISGEPRLDGTLSGIGGYVLGGCGQAKVGVEPSGVDAGSVRRGEDGLDGAPAGAERRSIIS